VLALKPHGGDRKSDQDNKNENVILNQVQGNSATYRIAKLKRDAPEIAEREIRSIKSDIITLDFSLRVRAGRGWKCEPLVTLSLMLNAGWQCLKSIK
jgi:hypothetical protein